MTPRIPIICLCPAIYVIRLPTYSHEGVKRNDANDRCSGSGGSVCSDALGRSSDPALIYATLRARSSMGTGAPSILCKPPTSTAWLAHFVHAQVFGIFL